MDNRFAEVLKGEDLKNGLLFAEYLKENDMAINGSEIAYKGKAICYMHLGESDEYPSPWTVWVGGDFSKEHEAVPISDAQKDIAWANVNICSCCGCADAPGNTKVIFGKTFEKLCSSDMAFYKPGGDNLEVLKKLLEMKK
ncbi:MAG: hypothetical protein FWE11_04750 [Defluviitaleaceae bacterium]|nr:hypothetical protein [Defluviitaleaceae bacterium]